MYITPAIKPRANHRIHPIMLLASICLLLFCVEFFYSFEPIPFPSPVSRCHSNPKVIVSIGKPMGYIAICDDCLSAFVFDNHFFRT